MNRTVDKNLLSIIETLAAPAGTLEAPRRVAAHRPGARNQTVPRSAAHAARLAQLAQTRHQYTLQQERTLHWSALLTDDARDTTDEQGELAQR